MLYVVYVVCVVCVCVCVCTWCVCVCVSLFSISSFIHLVIETQVHEVAMHVGLQQVGPHKMGQAKVLQVLACNKLVVFINCGVVVYTSCVHGELHCMCTQHNTSPCMVLAGRTIPVGSGFSSSSSVRLSRNEHHLGAGPSAWEPGR